ncbi:low-density lipoprotein receptor-like [Macrobrachium rosenbergii]|uniref:low-density lipoprotein receptor-like n=1 Tax=Macrobrachium rosenbergii TaxID=79674 RepID=UPI0034D41D53
MATDYSWIEKDCQEGTYECEDRSCIPRRWRCNAVSDCFNDTDEHGCDNCPEGFFFCSEMKCIEGYRVCDGQMDCNHGEDENKCEEKKNDACEGFQCLSGLCLHSTFFCDGIYDCDEGEDELLCVTKDEITHEFRQACSRYYPSLLEIHNETIGRRSQDCPLDDYNETASWSPMCSSEVFCDNFGCYDYELKKYLEFRSKEYDAICAYCTGDFNCWKKDWVDSWKQSSLDQYQLDWILKKKQSDFRDITSLYEPTTEVLEDASIPKKDFIFSCNFDGKACSDNLCVHGASLLKMDLGRSLRSSDTWAGLGRTESTRLSAVKSEATLHFGVRERNESESGHGVIPLILAAGTGQQYI